MNHIGVIGAGAWGTALAIASIRANLKTTIWSISSDEVEAINQRHEHIYRLPGIPLDPSLHATLDPQELARAEGFILSPPAQFMRSTCETFSKVLSGNAPLVIASKGIEIGTTCLMSEVVRDFFPNNPLFVLSGPSFASEVAKRLPTAVILAAENLNLSQELSEVLSSQYFRLYASDDMVGVQMGGACKNIIAIATGIIEGRGLGDNARAAAVTQGLLEIASLGCAMGGKQETFLGLSGVGDMILTCLCSQSRNKTFGEAVGKGIPLDELMASKNMLTEGVNTVSGAVKLAQKYGVKMPITFAMDALLNRGGSVETLIEALLSPPLSIGGYV